MSKEKEIIIRLYSQKAQLIKHYLIRMGCSHHDAEDIVQDTFIKAMDTLVHLTNENLSAWLFKVALHKYYDLCRKQKKHPQMVIDEVTFITYFVQNEDGIETLLHKEMAGGIQKVFDQLSETNKNLLLLKYDLGLSYEKISDLLGINQKNMKTYLYRARKEFQKKWEENENEQNRR